MLVHALAFFAAALGARSAAVCRTGGCDVSQLVLPLGSNQTNVTAPADQKLIYLALGLGVQNYTLDNTTGLPVSTGAVAKLFDASCKSSALADLTGRKWWQAVTYGVKEAQDAVQLGYLGEHYFQDFNGTASPVFDFRTGAETGLDSGYVVAKKNSSLNSPNNATTDVAWLDLVADAAKNNGTLATTVLRVFTAGGQPNSSYTVDNTTDLSVPYAAIYAFFTSA